MENTEKFFELENITSFKDYSENIETTSIKVCGAILDIKERSNKDGKKYDKDGNVRPQEKDWATSDKAKSAQIFKKARDRVTTDPIYITRRKEWRQKENANL